MSNTDMTLDEICRVWLPPNHKAKDELAALRFGYGKAVEIAKERDALRAFAQEVMTSWPDGDIDGSEVQDRAIEFGLLKLKDPAPTEPCGEGCSCVEYYGMEEWQRGEVVCYARTPLLTGETK